MTWPFQASDPPDGWMATKLRSILTRRKRTGRPDLQLLSVNLPEGVVLRRASDGRPAPSQDLSGYQEVRPHDLVVNQLGKPHGAIGVSALHGIISPAYFVAEIAPRAVPRYIHYLLRTRPYISEIERRGKHMPPSQFDISWEQFRDIPVALPPVSVQLRIIHCLDSACARSDALVSKKQHLIELVDERWNTWIRDKLESIASSMKPLKRHWRVIDCKHRTPTYVEDDNGYPVVSPGDVTPGRVDLSRAHRFVGQDDYRDLTGGSRVPKRGDIIYSRNASIGIAAYVDTDEAFCMGQDVCLITSDDMDQLFLMYVLNSIGLDQLEMQKIGTTLERVNVAQILEIQIPVPDQAVQKTLARRFDHGAIRRSRIIELLQTQIRLLQDRRHSLISATLAGDEPVSPTSV